MDVSSLMQTIAILAACVVYLAKQGFEFRQKKNGNGMSNRLNEHSSLLKELHGWHKPVADPKTGQPRFLWYEDSVELQEELKKSRETMEELRDAMWKMNRAIADLVKEIRSQQASP